MSGKGSVKVTKCPKVHQFGLSRYVKREWIASTNIVDKNQDTAKHTSGKKMDSPPSFTPYLLLLLGSFLFGPAQALQVRLYCLGVPNSPKTRGERYSPPPPKKCDKEKTFWGMQTIKYLSNFCLPQNNKKIAQRGLKTILFSGRLLHRPREQDLLQLLRVRQGHDRTGKNIEKCKCRNFNMSTNIIIF